jgi:hypothetical protein
MSREQSADPHKTWGSEQFGLPRAEADVMYAAFERVFGRKWLESGPATHRVVETWRRDDFLAGLEVAAVGSAVLDVERVDAAWVEQIAQQIRGARGGGEHGFIFELMACGMFAAGGMDVRPAPQAAPGVDAQLVFPDGYTLRLSFKNFDMSLHERTFRERSVQVRRKFRALVPAGRPLRLSVEGQVPLSAADFDAVEAALPHMRHNKIAHIRPGRVAAHIRPLHAEAGELSFAADRVSDQCIIISPEHANEQKGFQTKLRDACRNMAEHCPKTEGVGNFLLVRLSPTANTALMAERATQMVLERTPEVDAVLLYQPALIRMEEGQSVVVHHWRIVYSPNFDGRGHPIHMRPLLGVFSDQRSEIQLTRPDGQPLTLDGKYVFQAADFYRVMRQDQRGEWEGAVSTPAGGVRTHLVVEMADGSFDLNGLFPEHDNLRLL